MAKANQYIANVDKANQHFAHLLNHTV